MLPALAEEHYFANRPKGICLHKLLFWTCPTPFATTKSSPWPSKSSGKTCRFSTFSLFGPSWFEYASKLHIYLNVSPLEQEPHFCKSVHNHVQQKSSFSAWMCLRMPSCRIWAAKQISKKISKYVYYLHMGRSWGSLRFFDASNFLIFIIFYFSSLHFPWFFNAIQI